MRLPADSASEEYERRERTYLAAVRDGARQEELGDIANAVAQAADEWQGAAWASYHEAERHFKRDRETEAEIAEALTGLWRDIASAYRGEWKEIPN